MDQVAASTKTKQVQTSIKKTDYLFWPLVKILPKNLTPNHLSFVRLFLCFPIILLMWLHFFKTTAIFFLLAAILDGLDGSMARMRNQESRLGAILDPAADKIVNFAVFLGFLFYINSSIYKWLILPIILIDSLLFCVAFSKYLIKDVLPKLSANHWLNNLISPQQILQNVKVDKTGANTFGKIKMVLQVIVLSALLLFDPQASYFVHKNLTIPLDWTLLDIASPLLLACIIFGALSLWGHIQVIHLKK
ncbi:MAG: hypothetical protein GF365_02375 [Candidatus Buchananbacteria bacterium]|nr:hypothetical protein [Candidatus Buchananbacteria bacterium]